MLVEFGEGFSRLKSGFQFSLLANIIFALFIICMYAVPFLWFLYSLMLIFCIISYVIGVYERSRGWYLLHKKGISVVLVLGSLFILVSPFAGFFVLSFWWVYLWLLPIAWSVYTIFESYGFRELKRNYKVSFAKPTICNLLGISVLFLGLTILQIFSLSYILTPFLFVSPFLILSCFFTISKLKMRTSTPNETEKLNK